MKVYISGRIGEEVISDETRQRFAKAEEMLKAKGYETFNPADEQVRYWLDEMYESAKEMDETLDRYTYYLMKVMIKLAKCETIYMQENWRRSPGATAEYHFAVATKKTILFQSLGQAKSYLYEMYDTCPEGNEYNEWICAKAKAICLPL